MSLSEKLDDCTVVMAHHQLKGKGQMGALWNAEAGKNLTFSVLKKTENLNVQDQFLLNVYVSLAIYDTFQQLNLPNLSIKWPNDILSGHHKICGILIENVLLGNHIQQAIIGIGVNVNQLTFKDLPHASSLKLLLGRTFDLEELLQAILKQLDIYFSCGFEKPTKPITKLYEKVLFRKDKPSTFKNKEGGLFMGIITGISSNGLLCIRLENDVLKEFDLKEVQLLY